jgi:hypothetical protein
VLTRSHCQSTIYALARSSADGYAGRSVSLGDNIRRARIAAGYGDSRAAEFAREILHVSPGTLGDWESGRYKHLRLDNILKIATGAKCSVESLVYGISPDGTVSV